MLEPYAAPFFVDFRTWVDALNVPWAFGMHFEVDTSEVEPKDINGPAGGLHDSLVLPWGKIEPRLILGVFFHGEDAQVADVHFER